MIDWSARAASVFSQSRASPTAITDEMDVSSPLTVPGERAHENKKGVSSPLAVSDGGEIRHSPAANAKAGRRPNSRASPATEFMAPVAWTDADIARFTARRDRLIHREWSTIEAEAMAERLTQGDRAGDERVSCLDCKHYRPGRCGNHRAARLTSPEVGRDLAALPQHCHGFQP